MSELNSFGWLRGKKEAIINNNKNNNNNNNDNNDFQNALDDALSYQTIEKTHKEYQNKNLILISITGKG